MAMLLTNVLADVDSGKLHQARQQPGVRPLHNEDPSSGSSTKKTSALSTLFSFLNFFPGKLVTPSSREYPTLAGRHRAQLSARMMSSMSRSTLTLASLLLFSSLTFWTRAKAPQCLEIGQDEQEGFLRRKNVLCHLGITFNNESILWSADSKLLIPLLLG